MALEVLPGLGRGAHASSDDRHYDLFLVGKLVARKRGLLGRGRADTRIVEPVDDQRQTAALTSASVIFDMRFPSTRIAPAAPLA